jgi:tRNA pseudouridine65 synthase
MDSPETNIPLNYPPFEVLYEDDALIAINKPWGILVHRTGLSEDRRFVLQMLRDQMGGALVYVVHRLDRGTSGVLLFAKSSEMASRMGEQFMSRSVDKKYKAIVRGHAPEEITLDYALSDKETGKVALPARTHFRRLASSEIDVAIGYKYPTARFSLVECTLETGRRHQIRKHLAHLRYPVIGDVRHGDNKQNNYFKQHFQIPRMLLHAHSLTVEHPVSGATLRIEAAWDAYFEAAMHICQLSE